MSIRTGSAAIAVALLLSAVVLAASAGLEAQPGTLAFTPERPTAGEHIKVSYRPAANLAGEGAFRLRARIRTPAHGSYDTGMGSREVARLDVGADGVARGTFRLPQEAVYAAFAVETPGASRTDSREGRFWELLVHDDHGRPLLEALEQRFNDYMGRDMSEVLETAQTMSRKHPDAPAAWTALRAAEGWAGTADNEDARAARHQARLVELDRTLWDNLGLSASDIGSMYQYARGLGGEEIAARWRERMVAEHPADFFAVQERLGELFREHGDDREAFLTMLEPFWEGAADQRARRSVGHLGFQLALQMGDPEAILRWVDRYIVTEPASATWAMKTVAGIDATRDEGIRRLRAAISEVARGGW